MYFKTCSNYKACRLSCRIRVFKVITKCTIFKHLNRHYRILATTGRSGAEATKGFVQLRGVRIRGTGRRVGVKDGKVLPASKIHLEVILLSMNVRRPRYRIVKTLKVNHGQFQYGWYIFVDHTK